MGVVMFFVSDSQKERHTRIRAFVTDESATIAVILAAVDFEWSVRRAILALGTSPTKHIREVVFAKFHGGYGNYADAWKKEVAVWLKQSLDQAIPHWSRLTDKKVGAVRLRGQIVHGAHVSVSANFASPRVEDWLAASTLLEALANEHRTSLYKRIVRKIPRKTS
jgi:hypothetical protein